MTEPVLTEAGHDLIPLADPGRWAEALREVPHGHAHTWGFCAATQRTSGLPTYLYRYGHGTTRVVCPLAEREFSGFTDVFTPFGFGGFTAVGDYGDFPEHWAEFARSRGWVCGYIGLHPVFGDARIAAAGEAHVHNQLYVMDLRGSLEEIIARLSPNRRRELRGRTMSCADLEHRRPLLAEFLMSTYEDFYDRKGFARAARWAPETMAAFAELDDVLLVGARSDGELDAVAAFGHTPHGADYVLNVSLPSGQRHTANLVWYAVEWLRANGVPHLNLGGGVREGDDLAAFKRRFGAATLPLTSLRQVYRPDVYQALCDQTSTSSGDRSGYFPAYRA